MADRSRALAGRIARFVVGGWGLACWGLGRLGLMLAGLMLVGPGAAGCLKDLRPEGKLVEPTPQEAARGRELLDAMAAAHGGLESWRQAGPLKLVMSDTWQQGLTTTFFSPFDENPARFEIVLRPEDYDARLTLLEGARRGEVWGLQSWLPWKAEPDGEPALVDDDSILFWVPTIAYFATAPFRLGEANVVAAVGERSVDGEQLEGVFLSWGRAEPQEEIDQYVAWLDAKTHRLRYLEYTIRDIGGFVSGVMDYRGQTPVAGVLLPGTMITVDGPGGEPNLHAYEIHSAEEVRVKPGFLEPFPGQGRSKH